MNRKELKNTFMMISNKKKTFGLHGFYKKKSSALRVNLLIKQIRNDHGRAQRFKG